MATKKTTRIRARTNALLVAIAGPAGPARRVDALLNAIDRNMSDDSLDAGAPHMSAGRGAIDRWSGDPDAYALRLNDDSMHPAIHVGWFVVAEPNGRCTLGEYVALQLRDGRKMVRELISERQDEITVESVNGNARLTISRSDIESMHPVAAVVAASKWRPQSPSVVGLPVRGRS